MVRFGIIGMGMISKFYVDAIQQLNNIKLVSVCDNNKVKLINYKDVKVFNDYLDAVKDEHTDAIIIATPNIYHEEIINACITLGKHVICEKVLSFSSRNAHQLIQEALKSNILLFTAFHRRYNSNFINFKKKISKLNISLIKIRYLEDIKVHSESDYTTNITENGGGCIIDNGINCIDLLLDIFTELDIRNVEIEYSKNIHNIDYDSYSIIELQSKSVTSILELNWHSPVEIKDIQIITLDKTIEYCNLLSGYALYKESLPHEYVLILKDFVNRLETQQYEDFRGLEALKIVEQIYTHYNKIKF